MARRVFPGGGCIKLGPDNRILKLLVLLLEFLLSLRRTPRHGNPRNELLRTLCGFQKVLCGCQKVLRRPVRGFLVQERVIDSIETLFVYRVVADVWEFQAKSGSSGSCRVFLHFLGKITVQDLGALNGRD